MCLDALREMANAVSRLFYISLICLGVALALFIFHVRKEASVVATEVKELASEAIAFKKEKIAVEKRKWLAKHKPKDKE